MSLKEWLGALVPIGQLYLMWEQNRIAKTRPDANTPQAGGSYVMPESKIGRARRYWPMLAMGVLALVTWAGVAYGLYTRSDTDEMPEFDEARRVSFYSYGPTPEGCGVDVNGTAFLQFRKEYKIAAACAIFRPDFDVLDTPDLGISSERDIRVGSIPIVFSPNEKLKPLVYSHGVSFLILLVPKGTSTSQITTLREARSLGIKIKLAGSK